MPMYEYKCHACGQVFEIIQRFSDQPLTSHDGCGGNVERLLSAPALQFKGSGWYITDYAKGGGKASPGSSESAGTSKPETKTETSATPSKSSSTAETKK